MANSKVQLANGTVLIDLTDTTAAAADVAAGKYFYGADGVKTLGTASGGAGYEWVEEMGLSLVSGAVNVTYDNAANASSITAVYSPGSAIITTTDSIDRLRNYLVVTASYSDLQPDRVVTDYQLSGTLSAGTDTITVEYGPVSTTFNAVVVENPLDQVAFDGLTYREIFVNRNMIIIGNFDSTDSYYFDSSFHTLSNGDQYKMYYGGQPTRSSAYKVSGNYSLKCFGSSVRAFYKRPSTSLESGTRLLIAACIKCSRYSAGKAGVIFNAPINNAVDSIGAGLDSVTDGFTPVASTGVLAGNRTDWCVYLGQYNSCNADVYIDCVKLSVVPSSMTNSDAQTLYSNYISYILGGVT